LDEDARDLVRGCGGVGPVVSMRISVCMVAPRLKTAKTL